MIYRRLFDLPTWRFRSPFEELDQMKRMMERLLEETTSPRLGMRAGVFPLVNLTEDKDRYYLRAELPGVKSDELDIQATANSISLAGERKISEEEGVRYHRRERESGTFSRMISLPTEIEADKVEASMKDGVLTVVVPKAEAAKPRQITVH